jgi:hypothetical protein
MADPYVDGNILKRALLRYQPLPTSPKSDIWTKTRSFTQDKDITTYLQTFL